MIQKGVKRRVTTGIKPKKLFTREDVLALLTDSMTDLAQKIRFARIKDKVRFAAKIRLARALAYTASVYFIGAKDTEMEKVLSELSELEEQLHDNT